MKLINILSKLTKTSPNKGKKIALAIVFSLFVLFNLDNSIENTQRFLTEEEQMVEDFHDEQLMEGQQVPYVTRFLSKNLGGGNCQWTPPEELDRHETENTTTLLASYPGSGRDWHGDFWRLSLEVSLAMTGISQRMATTSSLLRLHILILKEFGPGET